MTKTYLFQKSLDFGNINALCNSLILFINNYYTKIKKVVNYFSNMSNIDILVIFIIFNFKGRTMGNKKLILKFV